jgi:hypothetical protein
MSRKSDFCFSFSFSSAAAAAAAADAEAGNDVGFFCFLAFFFAARTTV